MLVEKKKLPEPDPSILAQSPILKKEKYAILTKSKTRPKTQLESDVTKHAIFPTTNLN